MIKKHYKIRNAIVKPLKALAEFQRQRNVKQTLRLLFNLINADCNFDISLVVMLKNMIANFLEKNESIQINEIDITMPAILDNMAVYEFIEKKVLELNVYAKTIIFLIAPLVLRVNIAQYLLDFTNNDPVFSLPYF